MKIILIQNIEYLYYAGGAHKANRLLMEQLVMKGHECIVITYLSSSCEHFRKGIMQVGYNKILDFKDNYEYFSYTYNGVRIYTCKKGFFFYSFIKQVALKTFPDIILVTEDHTGLIIDITLEMPYKVVYIAHTQATLPFGNTFFCKDGEKKKLFDKLDGIITVSTYMQKFINYYGELDAQRIYFSSYEKKAYPNLGSIH